MNKAVFLDRDGVINDYSEPVNKPEDLKLYPWTAKAIKKLNDSNYQVFIVTNQGGIECGYFTAQDLKVIHQYLIDKLNQEGAIIDAIAYCPHFDSECNCRKPEPGMILQLVEEYDIDLDSSFMVGDRKSDIVAGNKAGCTTIKVGSKTPEANYSVENLADAVDIITKNNLIYN